MPAFKETIMINFALGKFLWFDVDMEKLMSFENVRRHAQELGIKTMLKASYASCVRADFETVTAWTEASHVKAREKLTALMSGDLGIRSASPTEAEILMVQVTYEALSKSKREELATHEDKGAAFIDAVIERHRAFIEKLVETELARRKAVAKKQADLSDMLDLDLDI